MAAIPGVSKAYTLAADKPAHSDVVWPEDQFVIGMDLNDAFAMSRKRTTAIGDLVAKNGDRVSGGDILVDKTTGTVTLAAGTVYIDGDVKPVPAAILNAVSMTGDVDIGVRLIEAIITSVQDPSLVGPEPGTEAEGEPAAPRKSQTLVWDHGQSTSTAPFYGAYRLSNGDVIDQTAPPQLSGFSQAIAVYDVDAHGNYVVTGCDVTALGVVDGNQRFSVSAGTSNIMGFKRTRKFDLLHDEPESPEAEAVVAEIHIYPGGASAVIPVNQTPIAAISSVLVEKQITESITRGGTTGGQDALSHTSITSVVGNITVGGTNYLPGTSFLLTADKIDWSPAGAEPTAGTSFSVTYKYMDIVALGPGGYTATDTAITVENGITGGQVQFAYSWKLPRTDILCLDRNGDTAYVKGIASPTNPLPPETPTELLKLAEITNVWGSIPTVKYVGTRRATFDEERRYFSRVDDLLDLVALLRLTTAINTVEPTAKLGVFEDPFENDFYRDAGRPQTAAVFNNQMSLGVDVPAGAVTQSNHEMLTLDYTSEVIVTQALASACWKINPYQSFTFEKAILRVNPASDFWTEYDTVYTSAVTQSATGNTQQTIDQVVDKDRNVLPFLRQITVLFSLSGFLTGESIQTMTFGGIAITPTSSGAANASGVVTGSFVIPAKIKAGTKLIKVTGDQGTKASASFVGKGTVDITTRQLVTLVPQASSVEPLTEHTQDNDHWDHIDPLAQSFSLTQSRFISAVDLQFCNIGSTTAPVIVNIVKMQNGFPTLQVVAQSIVAMNSIALNTFTRCTLEKPVFIPANVQYAIVIQTNDPNHSVRVAQLGKRDIATNRGITRQPYTVGVLFSSSNNISWTTHQDFDLTFRLIACKFAPLTKTVKLGNISVTNCSDILIMAAAEYPTKDASLYFTIKRSNGTIYKLNPGQSRELQAFLSETLEWSVVMAGTANISPVLYPGSSFVSGSIRSSGTYETRQFGSGAPTKLLSRVKAKVPAGSTLVVEHETTTSGVYSALTLLGTEALNEGWTEYKYQKTGFTQASTRMKITITGGPSARPKLTDFRAFTV